LDLLLLRLRCLLKEARECPEEEERDDTEAVDAIVDTDPRRCGFHEWTEEKLAFFATPRFLMGKECDVTSRMFFSSASSSKSNIPKSSSFT
jgi:hypothetical protein